MAFRRQHRPTARRLDRRLGCASAWRRTRAGASGCRRFGVSALISLRPRPLHAVLATRPNEVVSSQARSKRVHAYHGTAGVSRCGRSLGRCDVDRERARSSAAQGLKATPQHPARDLCVPGSTASSQIRWQRRVVAASGSGPWAARSVSVRHFGPSDRMDSDGCDPRGHWSPCRREPTPGPAPSTGGDKCFRLT